MTHDDDARVAELIGRLGDGDTNDLFRRLLERGMQDLIDAEFTTAIGAEPHERTDGRSNHRNGGRQRLLSTPAGDIELRIPKLRVGSFFPSPIEPRRRVDRALWAVIMTAYVTGTSTRKVDDLAFRALVQAPYSSNAADQEALVQVGVFLGGFTAADAAIVSRDKSPTDAAKTMDRLVRSSLVSRQDRRYGTRYRLLETVRDFVGEQEPLLPLELASRHADAVLAACEHGASAALGPEEAAWAQRISDERANILAAFRQLSDTGDATGALRLAIASYLIALPRRHVDLGMLPSVAVELAEASTDVDSGLLVEAIGLAADAAVFGGEPLVAHQLITRARLIDAPPHAHRYVDAVIADLALYAGDIERAVAHHERARVGFERRGQLALAAWMSAFMPLARSYGDHPDDQVGDALRALDTAQGTRCPSAIAFSRYAYAEVVRLRDTAEANRELTVAIADALAVDAFFVAALARLSLATDASARGEHQRSAQLHREVIAEWQPLGNWTQQWNTLRTAAILLSRAERHEHDLTILAALDRLAATDAWGADAGASATAISAAHQTLTGQEAAEACERAQQLGRLEVVDHTIRALEQVDTDCITEH